jgi:hypothetical protein
MVTDAPRPQSHTRPLSSIGADRFGLGRWGGLTTGAPVLLVGVGVLDCQFEEIIERPGIFIATGGRWISAQAPTASP